MYQPLTKFRPPAEAVPGCGWEKVSEPLVRAECQMRTSTPIHPKGCCCMKLRVLSLTEHPIHPNHQTAKRRNNIKNMECPLSTYLWKSTGVHPWVKTLLIGHPGPCRDQIDRVWRNYHRWGTQDLVLQRRLKTPVCGGIHCRKRSCR